MEKYMIICNVIIHFALFKTSFKKDALEEEMLEQK